MNFETFFVNAVKLAASPSVSNLPVLELSKKDMSELSSYLEEKGIGATQENEQEIRFTVNNLNFTAIENDKSEDVGLYGKVIEPARYEAVLDEEQQAIADKNTDTFNVVAPENQLNEGAQEAVDLREHAAEEALAGNTAEKLEKEKAEQQQQMTAPQKREDATKEKGKKKTAAKKA